MKEIDFIPEWYRTGRRKKVGYKRQYVIIACLFACMVMGNFVLGLWVSHGTAEVSQTEGIEKQYAQVKEEYNRLQDKLGYLATTKKMLDMLDPNVNFSAVIGEVSHLMPANLVLSELKINAEESKQDTKKPGKIILLGNTVKEKTVLPDSTCIFHVTITGVGANVSDVAKLLSNLEGSSYFHKISPGYIRDKEFKGYTITEFEVNCYLANYIQKEGETR